MSIQLLRKIIELALRWGSSLTISQEEMKVLFELINK